MAKFLRAFLLLLALCVVTWVVVIAYWQRIHLEPGVADVALYLVALPVALWLVAMVVLAVRRRRALKAAALAAAPAAAAVAATAPKAAAAKQLLVMAAEVVTPIGTDLGSIGETLRSEWVPPLDTELTDYNGFPLPARRHTDLDLGQLPSRWQDDRIPTTQARTLALLAELLPSLAPTLATLANAQQALLQPVGQAPRAAVLNPAWHGEAVTEQRAPQKDARVPLQLHLQWLLDDTGLDLQDLQHWLLEALTKFGLAPERIAISLRTLSGAALPAHLSKAVDELSAQTQPVVVLLLAAGSTLSQQVVDGWLDEGRTGQGALHFAGEAAAALLLCNEAVRLEGCAPIARLGVTYGAPCDTAPAKAHAAKVLPGLMQTLQAAQPLPAEMNWLCSGLAMGPEAIEVSPLLQAAPEQVQMEDVLHLRGGLGEAGVAGRLSAYALACLSAEADDKATLLVLNDGTADRGLCLVEPAAIKPVPDVPDDEEAAEAATA